jgi:hypothetical protein
MTAAKRAATFRLDDEIVDALQQVKDQHGIPLTEQVNRALELWLETMGVAVSRAQGGKTMRLIERISGTGRILDDKGQHAADGKYDLSIWQEVHHVKTFGGSSSVDGLRDTKGTITTPGIAKLVGKNLTIELQDGRVFPFFFSDSAGTIAARGAISNKQ